MDVDIVRHVDSDQLGTIVFRRADDFQGDNSFTNDPLIVVNIVEKKIQRPQALLEAPLENLPLIRWNNPRDQIERHDSLGSLVTAVNRKGDPLVEIGFFSQRALSLKCLSIHFRETFQNPLVVWANLPIPLEHFVKKPLRFVTIEKPLRHAAHHSLSDLQREAKKCFSVRILGADRE